MIRRHSSQSVMRMTTLLMASSALLLSGCAATQSTARKQAADRWARVRAQVKVKLAADQLAAGHIEDAANELASAIELAPDNDAAISLQARIHLARGETAAAEHLLTTAASSSPQHAENEYLLGVLCEQRLQWPAALEHYQPVSYTHLRAHET